VDAFATAAARAAAATTDDSRGAALADPTGASAAPQCTQNLAVERFSFPQLVQFIASRASTRADSTRRTPTGASSVPPSCPKPSAD